MWLINWIQILLWQKQINFLSSKHHQKIHIQKNMHFIYKQDLYEDKQNEIYEPFIKYLFTILEDLDNISLIEEWKQNLDSAAYEKI